MSTTIDQLCQTLAILAPLRLAESWDNVGLLAGDRAQPARRVMTCLTISPPVVEEAIEESADLVVTHHPLPFQPLDRLTSDGGPGRLLLELIRGGVAVYSAHTAYDSAAEGINQQWADGLQLRDVAPLQPLDPSDLASAPATLLGAGRCGRPATPMSLSEVAKQAARLGGAKQVRCVGGRDDRASKVAIACGSGGSFLDVAIEKGCDVLVTGEATFHTCLEAETRGVGLVLLGHYASERFAMESLAEKILASHPRLSVWACGRETDPIWAV